MALVVETLTASWDEESVCQSVIHSCFFVFFLQKGKGEERERGGWKTEQYSAHSTTCTIEAGAELFPSLCVSRFFIASLL